MLILVVDSGATITEISSLIGLRELKFRLLQKDA